jgi:hypothetical protein
VTAVTVERPPFGRVVV